jgi:cysteine desulfurase
MRQVYLDYNATAPLEPAAREAIEDVLAGPLLGNPSSTHAPGQRARLLLDAAREELLRITGLERTHHLVFCSGGTEGNHLALRRAPGEENGGALLTTALEHPSLLEAARARAAEGGLDLELLPVDAWGRIERDAFVAAARRARLCAVHAAHNELGTLQDLAALRAAMPAVARLHADACQYWGKVAFDLSALRADTLVISAHKIGGPVGIGALFLRKDLELEPMLRGGGQERGYRAGTESVMLAHAFAAAARAREQRAAEDAARVSALREQLRSELEDAIPALRVLTPSTGALANTLCVTLPRGDGRALLMAAQLQGLAISSGSACSSGAARPSAALLALGLDEASARRSLRLSLGPATTSVDIAHAVSILRALHARFAALDVS